LTWRRWRREQNSPCWLSLSLSLIGVFLPAIFAPSLPIQRSLARVVLPLPLVGRHDLVGRPPNVSKVVLPTFLPASANLARAPHTQGPAPDRMAARLRVLQLLAPLLLLLLLVASRAAADEASRRRPRTDAAAAAAAANDGGNGGFIPGGGGGDWPSGPPGGGGDWPSGPPGSGDDDKKKKKKKRHHHRRGRHHHHRRHGGGKDKPSPPPPSGTACSTTREKKACRLPCVWCRNKGSPFPGSDGVCLEAAKVHDLPPMIYECGEEDAVRGEEEQQRGATTTTRQQQATF